eukprot:6479638-Prymnesium_polylepis.1
MGTPGGGRGPLPEGCCHWSSTPPAATSQASVHTTYSAMGSFKSGADTTASDFRNIRMASKDWRTPSHASGVLLASFLSMDVMGAARRLSRG